MSTTLLFVELVIAGIQVMVWIVLLILTVFGYEWLAGFPIQAASDWQVLITAVLLSLIYVLGILFDRLADVIFSRWDQAIARRRFPNAPQVFSVMRFQLSKDNEYLNRQFEYIRSRLRIARSSSLNFAITTILGLIFVATRLQWLETQSKLLAFIGIAGSALTALAVATWYLLVRTYFGLIRANYMGKAEQEKAKANTTKTGR